MSNTHIRITQKVAHKNKLGRWSENFTALFLIITVFIVIGFLPLKASYVASDFYHEPAIPFKYWYFLVITSLLAALFNFIKKRNTSHLQKEGRISLVDENLLIDFEGEIEKIKMSEIKFIDIEHDRNIYIKTENTFFNLDFETGQDKADDFVNHLIQKSAHSFPINKKS